MLKFVSLLALVLGVATAKYLDAPTSVTLQVYYETLCPDSIDFLVHQLHPSYVNFGGDVVQVELIPYGFASEDNSTGEKVFTCQHGPEECYGNKVHSCVINAATVNQTVNFVFCAERSASPANSTILQGCAEQNDISWTDVEDCLSSGLADDLLSANGNKTKVVDPSFIPTITIDNVYSQDNQDGAIKHLKTLLCNILQYPIEYCRC
ncbi:gamma-interferon-inducible lysosomal thiol reductase-like [Sitophilus oryzae]|uniref:Gamma-interferon-inducible lysosomal thiol reductase-like n=1 Tax=Sitophilus oryzae TaxID=7048 RepID=A0A6J2YNP8_SITOR|nr:gamma-interferon-inducible lysosomal thiol reductase-like [Sitophilus oryzae]